MNQDSGQRAARTGESDSLGGTRTGRDLLDRMYRTALFLTDTEEQAEAMVLDVLRDSDNEEGALDRTGVRQIRSLVDHAAGLESHPDFRSHLRSSIVQRLLNNNFPIAFAALERDEQLALYLHYSDLVSDEDAEAMLSIDTGVFGDTVDAAASRVVELFLESLPTTERGLVLDEDNDEWVGQAIRDAIDSLLPATPDSLRSKMTSAVKLVGKNDSGRENQNKAGRGRKDIRKMLVAGVLIAATLIASLWWLTSDDPEPRKTVDLLALTILAANKTTPDLAVSSELAVEEYVMMRTDRGVVVPRFRDSELTGASIQQVDIGLEVPAISYVDTSEWGPSPFTVFIYSYKMLGARERGPRLASTVLKSLDSEVSFTRAPTGVDTLLVWRHRTNIYVAVGSARTIDTLEDRTELQSPLGSR